MNPRERSVYFSKSMTLPSACSFAPAARKEHRQWEPLRSTRDGIAGAAEQRLVPVNMWELGLRAERAFEQFHRHMNAFWGLSGEVFCVRTLPYYFRRLSKKTACSPSRFQNHQGALNRSARPHASSATAFSILAPTTPHSSRKSLMVQKWILGESHQA